MTSLGVDAKELVREKKTMGTGCIPREAPFKNAMDSINLLIAVLVLRDWSYCLSCGGPFAKWLLYMGGSKAHGT